MAASDISHALPDETMNDIPAGMTMNELFAIIEAELVDLGAYAERMQEVLSPALVASPESSLCRQEAQMLDILTQRLQGLRTFMEHLRRGLPETWLVDPSRAARAVVLGTLAERLSGAKDVVPLPAAGEIELF
ncbi:hypothetical protein [Acidiphilium sp.]|uniref:hypothetical protein n=1 Tax=Acidiphilium sp. TaxID=527 RepID=UPI00258BDB61|nr:hypothetical protein [Acidiphilium sp.]